MAATRGLRAAAGIKKGDSMSAQRERWAAWKSLSAEEKAAKLGSSGEIVVASTEAKQQPRSRFGKLIDSMGNIDQQEIKNDAKAFGITAKLITDAGGNVNIDNTTPAIKSTGKRSFSRLIKDMEANNQADLKNMGKLYGTAAKAYTIRESQVNSGTKKLSGSQKQKQIKGA